MPIGPMHSEMLLEQGMSLVTVLSYKGPGSKSVKARSALTAASRPAFARYLGSTSDAAEDAKEEAEAVAASMEAAASSLPPTA